MGSGTSWTRRASPTRSCTTTTPTRAQELARKREHVSGHRVAKVVGVMVDGRPVELVLPASRRVMLEQVSQLLGAKLEVRLASEQELEPPFSPNARWSAIPGAAALGRGVDVIMDGNPALRRRHRDPGRHP